jgi:hypothetical protein
LVKESVISDFADLSRLTLGQIMERSNFGLKSLVELLTEIQPLVLESVPVQGNAPAVGVASTVQAGAPEVASTVQAGAPEVASSVQGSAQQDGVASSNQLSSEDIEQIITQSRPLTRIIHEEWSGV